jgi:nucleoside-diphosphate-sugar epimerase
MKVLILGVNGFIGSHLAERILSTTDWEVQGHDLRTTNLESCLPHPRFAFRQNDMRKDGEWIEQQVSGCDVILPLVAVAQPKKYVEDPLFIFELDFEENLKIVRLCDRYGKRLVFPSTSEVYGMSQDPEFKEDESNLVLGPICKTRWIYSCSKQMLDRVIAAYGMQRGLRYTLFRPFNWLGPRLDDNTLASEGKSRVLTQFIYNMLQGLPIQLVGGGEQKRCFTDIDDGIGALMAILRNEGGVADGQIFNIGNPKNNFSIRELAEVLKQVLATFPSFREKALQATILDTPSAAYYGEGYEDVEYRVPSIEKARRLLGWEPRTSLEDTLRKTISSTVAAGTPS